jgi:hypothetical protein
LKKLDLDSVTIFTLSEIEEKYPELLEIKPSRTTVEYCWTLTPILPLYILEGYKISDITYLDADLFFYSSPEPIFEELGANSILLIEHRYTKSQKMLEKYSGRFNVQFLTFRNNRDGLLALHWWKKRCLEWCFFRYEAGKMGDQLYLHDWPARFKGVHVLENIGAGVAPWNVQQYSIIQKNSIIYVNTTPLLFYHFHGFLIHDLHDFSLAPRYWIQAAAKKCIYQPYIDTLIQVVSVVQSKDSSWRWGVVERDPFWKRILVDLVALKKYLVDRNILPL